MAPAGAAAEGTEGVGVSVRYCCAARKEDDVWALCEKEREREREKGETERRKRSGSWNKDGGKREREWD